MTKEEKLTNKGDPGSGYLTQILHLGVIPKSVEYLYAVNRFSFSRQYFYLASTCLALFYCTLFVACSRSPKIFQRTQFLMGTYVEIKIFSEGPQKADEAISSAFKRIKEIEDMMSAKKGGTWLRRISTQAVGKPLDIPKDLMNVITISQKYSELTNGAFDITIGAITRLWEFDDEMKGIPDKGVVEDALQYVNFQQIHLDEVKGTIMLDSNQISLDLGAVAKGYAVDEAVKSLQAMGMTAGLVNAGGDLKVFGKKPDGSPWNIGIQNPEDAQTVMASIILEDSALVTSGDYERYIIYDGVKYHHILDPKTGWPARGCKSVSVACESALEADILSTSLFVMGPDAGTEFLEALPHIEGMIVDDKEKVYISKGWEHKLNLIKRRK